MADAFVVGPATLPVEGTLEGEAVHDVEFAEHHHAARALLARLNPEGAPREGKRRKLVAAQQGNNPELCIFNAAFLLVVLEGAPVKKSILLARVAMHVAVESDLALPLQKANQLLGVVNRRVQKLVRRQPLSVQVTAKQTAPVVALDDAVWVEHGHNEKDKVLAELLCHLRVG